MTIKVRNLYVGYSVWADFSEAYIPYGKEWKAWCGISFVYPTAGFTNPSFVVADIYRESGIIGEEWEQIRSPFAWGDLFGGKGNILNPRSPTASGKTDLTIIGGGGVGTTLYFRLYRRVQFEVVRAGGFGVVHYNDL